MSAEAYQLKSRLIGHEIILGDFAEIPATMLKAGNFLKLPKPTDAAYMHLMLALCLDNGIEQIYALNITEFEGLTNTRELFEEYGITILSASDEV